MLVICLQSTISVKTDAKGKTIKPQVSSASSVNILPSLPCRGATFSLLFLLLLMQLLNDLLSSLKLPATFISRYALAFLILSLYACANWLHFACVSSCVWGQRMVIFQSTGHTCISIADKAELLIFFLMTWESWVSSLSIKKLYLHSSIFWHFKKCI